MSPIKLLALALLLLLIFATPTLRAEHEPKETPETRAKRLKILRGKIADELSNILDDDVVVVRGVALELIAKAGPEPKEIDLRYREVVRPVAVGVLVVDGCPGTRAVGAPLRQGRWTVFRHRRNSRDGWCVVTGRDSARPSEWR